MFHLRTLSGGKLMQDLILRNKTIKFWKVTGEVIGNQKYSETHVSSSGGGGFVSNSGGYVEAPSVNSTTILNQDFWIRTEDGQEIPIQLKDSDIPLRIGQKISVIYSRREESDSGWASTLVNHSANRYWHINNYEVLSEYLKVGILLKNHKLRFFLMTISIYILSIVIIFQLEFLVENFEFYSGLVISIFPILIIVFLNKYYNFRLKKASKALQSHLENLSQQAFL